MIMCAYSAETKKSNQVCRYMLYFFLFLSWLTEFAFALCSGLASIKYIHVHLLYMFEIKA